MRCGESGIISSRKFMHSIWDFFVSMFDWIAGVFGRTKLPLVISPSSVEVISPAQLQLSATVGGKPVKVTWTTTAGTVVNGLLSISVSLPTLFTVTATDSSGRSARAMVDAYPPLSLSAQTPTGVVVAAPYEVNAGQQVKFNLTL